MRASRDTFAREVHTVSHVIERVDRFHGLNVRFVVDKIRIGLDGGGHLGEICAGLEFDVHHAAVNAGAEGNGHRKRVVYSVDGAHGHGVTHRAAGAEVGVGHALRRKAFHKGAHHRVGTGIPTGGHHAHGVVCLRGFVERATQIDNTGVDVERIDRVNAERKALFGVGFYAAGGCGKDSDVYILQFGDVLHHGIGGKFGRAINGTVAANHTGTLHVGRGLDGFEGVFTNVSVTDDGGANFLFHKQVRRGLVCVGRPHHFHDCGGSLQTAARRSGANGAGRLF